MPKIDLAGQILKVYQDNFLAGIGLVGLITAANLSE